MQQHVRLVLPDDPAPNASRLASRAPIGRPSPGWPSQSYRSTSDKMTFSPKEGLASTPQNVSLTPNLVLTPWKTGLTEWVCDGLQGTARPVQSPPTRRSRRSASWSTRPGRSSHGTYRWQAPQLQSCMNSTRTTRQTPKADINWGALYSGSRVQGPRFPFVGCDIRYLDASNPEAGSGTMGSQNTAGRELPRRLIFEYPSEDSYNYTQCNNTLYVPWGVIPQSSRRHRWK